MSGTKKKMGRPTTDPKTHVARLRLLTLPHSIYLRWSRLVTQMINL